MADVSITRIYVLRDPRDGEVRYVGKTAYPLNIRRSCHISHAIVGKKRTHCAAWLRSLHALGLVPLIEQIDSATEEWAACEQKWISYYQAAGARLTNHTRGGEGVPGFKQSAETIKKRAIKHSKTMSAVASTPEGRAELASHFASTMASPTWRAWQSERVKAHNATPEWKAANAAYWNEESRMIAAERARVQWTPERRAAIKETWKRKMQAQKDQQIG